MTRVGALLRVLAVVAWMAAMLLLSEGEASADCTESLQSGGTSASGPCGGQSNVVGAALVFAGLAAATTGGFAVLIVQSLGGAQAGEDFLAHQRGIGRPSGKSRPDDDGAGQGSGTGDVATSLEEVRQVFLRGTRDDADVTGSFLRAMDRAMADERIVLYTGTLEQRRATVAAVLRRHARPEDNVEAHVTEVFGRLEREGNAGLYDSATNTIFVHGDRAAASTAATVAHELAHQLQRIRVRLGNLAKSEAEFQAMYLQKLFLRTLDVSPDRVPEEDRWLIDADHGAIEEFVKREYRHPAPERANFANLEASAAWILGELRKL